MSITKDLRELVRQRAKFSCEFCGITETDCGGELTVDHFRPTTKGGSDDPDNLVYCCSRCNLYKLDYYPASLEAPVLWNPRLEPFSMHFFSLSNGILYPLTSIGEFTLNRLRLNRPPLIASRLRTQQNIETTRLLNHYQELVQLLRHLNNQLAELTEEQKQLLEEQQQLLKLLLGRLE